MNSDGLSGTCSALGEWVDEKFEVTDDCEGKTIINKPEHLYKKVYYKVVWDIRQFKGGPQKHCIQQNV